MKQVKQPLISLTSSYEFSSVQMDNDDRSGDTAMRLLPNPHHRVDGELPIPLNRRLSRSDTIPPCTISSSFSFISSPRFFGLQSQVDGGPSLPNLRWCDINCYF